jgi:hypothetical protein
MLQELCLELLLLITAFLKDSDLSALVTSCHLFNDISILRMELNVYYLRVLSKKKLKFVYNFPYYRHSMEPTAFPKNDMLSVNHWKEISMILLRPENISLLRYVFTNPNMRPITVFILKYHSSEQIKYELLESELIAINKNLPRNYFRSIKSI